VLLAPFAGALVDRWDRRLTMLGADVLAAASTAVIALLYFTDGLTMGHIYALVGIGAIGNTFQAPAWMASVPLLVPKRHLGRANGLDRMVDAIALVSAPAIAGALLGTVGLGAILVVDLATFAVGVVTLMMVRFPRPEHTEETAGASIREDIRLGWRYLQDRTGLLWLLGMYAGVNFVISFANVLFIPLIVTFSSEQAAGGVLSIAGIGALIGSVVMSAWGGPRKRIAGVTVGIVFAGACVALTGLRPSIWLIGTGAFLLMFGVPVINTISQVLWQLKVAPAMQGRVFALRRMISQAISPLAILTAGPLADAVFEPLMAEDGAFAGTLGRVIGTGPGRGIGLMVILSGIGVMLVGVAGWLHPRVRHLETELPDQITEETAAAG
jgi:predicted MFS family arabinose efflux permease